MLDSMEGVEREFHSRGDSLLQLETSLHTSNGALCAMQEQLEARDVALNAQRLELDRRLQAEEALLQQLHETEAEGREMMEFLQAEKLALQDAVRDSENEMVSLKAQIEDDQKQLSLKEEECQHLVRLAEQRRHELAAMQAELKGAEGRTGSVLMAQGARLSAAALALVKLHSRMDGLLQSLMNSHSLPPGVHVSLELEGKVAVLKLPAEKDPVLPQVILSAAGDASSYRLVLSREGSENTFTVEGLADGTLKVTRPGSTP